MHLPPHKARRLAVPDLRNQAKAGIAPHQFCDFVFPCVERPRAEQHCQSRQELHLPVSLIRITVALGGECSSPISSELMPTYRCTGTLLASSFTPRPFHRVSKSRLLP
jgi:hypothetical protein